MLCVWLVGDGLKCINLWNGYNNDVCISILVPTTGNAADSTAAADCSSGQAAATATFK